VNYFIALPILLGLASALTWGSADFIGGVLAKRTNSYGIVILGQAGSLFLLVPAALLFRETLPPLGDWLIGVVSGVAGGAGLMLLYRCLADGRMTLASPVAGLVGAGIPVLVGIGTEGLPGGWMLIGFGLALLAIWLISQTGKVNLVSIMGQLRLPVLAGFCFGIFFVGIHQASGVSILWPLVATRLGSVPSLFLYTRLLHQPWLPESKHWKSISLISLLDTAGNVFFILSSVAGRLDVAAVVSSLYPGSTVALAYIILKEKISPTQMVGILCALVALVLISM
jgi:drug/metabolite transporter (DMT)-like permease